MNERKEALKRAWEEAGFVPGRIVRNMVPRNGLPPGSHGIILEDKPDLYKADVEIAVTFPAFVDQGGKPIIWFFQTREQLELLR